MLCLTETDKSTFDNVKTAGDADSTVHEIGKYDRCESENEEEEHHHSSNVFSKTEEYDHSSCSKQEIKKNKSEIGTKCSQFQPEINNTALKYNKHLPQFDIAELLNLITILESLLLECLEVSNNFTDPFARECARSVHSSQRNSTTTADNNENTLQTRQNVRSEEINNNRFANNTASTANQGEDDDDDDDIETDEMYKEYASTQWIVPELRWSATILLAKLLGVEPRLHHEYLWTWRDGDVYYEYSRKEKEKFTRSYFNGDEEVTSTDGRFVINLANMTATDVRLHVITRVHFQPVPLCSTFADQNVQFITRNANTNFCYCTNVEKLKETLRALSFSCTPTAVIAKVLLLHIICQKLPQNEEEQEDIASVFRSVIADVDSSSLERFAEQLVYANAEWAAILVNHGIIDALSMSAPSLLAKSTLRHRTLHADKRHHERCHAHQFEDTELHNLNNNMCVNIRKNHNSFNDHRHTNSSTIGLENAISSSNGKLSTIDNSYCESKMITNVGRASTTPVAQHKHNMIRKSMNRNVEDVATAKRQRTNTPTRNTSTRTSPALAWIREVSSTQSTQKDDLSDTKQHTNQHEEVINTDIVNKSPSPLSFITMPFSNNMQSNGTPNIDDNRRCTSLAALTLPESNVSRWQILLDDASYSVAKLLRVFDVMALCHDASQTEIDCVESWLDKEHCNRERVADVLAIFLIKSMQKISLEARTGKNLLDTVCTSFTTCTVNIQTTLNHDEISNRYDGNNNFYQGDSCTCESVECNKWTSTQLEEMHKMEINEPLSDQQLENIISIKKMKKEEELEKQQEENKSMHLLKIYHGLNWQCNECGCHTGYAALSCRRCNYDICFRCVQVQTGKLDVSTTATLGDVLQSWRSWHNTDSVDCNEENSDCNVADSINERSSIGNTNTCKRFDRNNDVNSHVIYSDSHYYHTLFNNSNNNTNIINDNNNKELLGAKENELHQVGDCVFTNGKLLLSSAVPVASVRDRLLHISTLNPCSICSDKHCNDDMWSKEFLTKVINYIYVTTPIPESLSLLMPVNKYTSEYCSLNVSMNRISCANNKVLTDNGWSHLFLSVLCNVAEHISSNTVLVHSIMEAVESCGKLIFLYGVHNLPTNLYTVIAVLGRCWSFELKYKFCKFVAIDCYRYAMKHLQDANIAISGVVHGEVESNGLSCKVKINREDMFATINTLYCTFAGRNALRNKMEFQFDGEEGTGSGPTQELYSTLSRYFRSSRKFWAIRDDENVDSNNKENEHGGNSLHSGIDNNEIHHEYFVVAFPTCRRLYYKEFYVLGALCGRAFIDHYRISVDLISEVWGVLRSTISVKDMLYEVEDVTATAIWKLFEAIFPSIAHSYKELLEAFARSDENMDYVASYELEDDTGVLITRHNIKAFIAERILHYFRYGLCNLHAFARGLITSLDLSSLEVLSDAECSRMLCGSFGQTSHNLTIAATAATNNNNDDNDNNRLFSSEQLREAITEAHGYNSDSPQVKMLIKIVGDEFTREQQEHFLEFLTGSSLLPLNGLCGLGRKITVVRKDMEGANEETLPSCNTCFLYFKLPPYSSHEMMKKRLLFAVTEGRRNFSLS